MEIIKSPCLFILLFCQSWAPVTISAINIDCASCPENRRTKNKAGFFQQEGCLQEDVVKMKTPCDVCAVAIGAVDVTEEVKLEGGEIADFRMTEGWIHYRGCAPPKAKPGTCERKGDRFSCYCDTPLCNLNPPDCAWLRVADKRIPDPKGCVDVMDGEEAEYTMGITVNVETTKTITKYIEEKETHHKGTDTTTTRPRSTLPPGTSGCSRFNSNKKACRANQCEIKLDNEACTEPAPCSAPDNIKYCPRPGVFYLDGGTICRSAETTENCPPLEHVLGTKTLLKDGQNRVDHRGIIYRHEVIREDTMNTRASDEASMTKCNQPLESLPPSVDKSLYSPIIYGHPSKKDAGGCLTYAIPPLTEGEYELSMKFMEYLYTSPSQQRGFSVNLESNDDSRDLMYDLNVFQYVGHCQPFELLLPMRVTAASLVLQGFPDMTYKGEGGSLSISFCYGEDAQDPSYVLSAFYVGKLRADCTTHGANKGACKAALCEFNLAKGSCENRKPCKFDPDTRKDLRAGKYYLQEGTLCYNTDQDKDAPAIEVVNAVRVLLDDGQSVTDSRGVLYQSEKNYEDPEGTRVVDWDGLKRCDLTYLQPEADREVYYPVIYGKTGKRQTKGCLSYPLGPLDHGDGDYELSLKFLEFFYKDFTQARGFSVRLTNDRGEHVELLYDLNVFSYVGHCNPLEILALLSLSGSSLVLKGLPPLDIGASKIVKLSFCYGDSVAATGDPNYILSAFYLAKLAGSCQKHGSDKVACRTAGCEVNTAKNTCENRQPCEKNLDLGDRLWGDVYYVSGGTLCYNKKEKGYNFILDKLVGQKIGLGQNQVLQDSKKLSFGPESTMWDDRKVYTLDRSFSNCAGVGFPFYEDRAFHNPIAVGNPNKANPSNCLQYHSTKLPQDGTYEIFVKFIETKYGSRDQVRQWNFILKHGPHRFHLLYQHNTFSYVGKCRQMEIVTIVKLYKGQLTVQGFPPVPHLSDHVLWMDFCYGERLPNVVDTSFHLSAVYVGRVPKNCAAYGQSVELCRLAGCQPNTVTLQCENKKSECDPSLNVGGSLRGNVHYASAGVACFNEKQRGPKLNPIAVVATKLGVISRQTFVDPRGIVYRAESKFEDPHGTRTVDHPFTRCDANRVFPIADRYIYNPEILGNYDKRDTRGCVKYTIPTLTIPGDYELSMKFWEDYWETMKTIRRFNVELYLPGGVKLMLLRNMNVYYYVGGKCQQMEMVFPMQYSKNDILTVHGFPNQVRLNGQVMKLAFCMGEGFDPNYLVSAFHVARLTPNCESYGGNRLKCRENQCEVNLAKGTCHNRKTCEVGGSTWERMRSRAFFLDGGTICFNYDKLGDNSFKKILWGVKSRLQGNSIQDPRTFVYNQERTYEDTHKIRLDHARGDVCPDATFHFSQEFKHIYFPQVNSDPAKAHTGGCIRYRMVPLAEEGDYELSIKFIENYIKEEMNTRRGFNIKLESGPNVIHLVYDLNVWSYVKDCNPMELITFISVTGKSLIVKGYPAIPNSQYVPLTLSFCYGEDAEDKNFMFGAFYLTKMVPGCKERMGDKKACRRGGCEWNTVTKMCHARTNCNTLADFGKCLREQSYYLNAGVLCWNEYKQGSCPLAKVYAAVKSNLGRGQTRTDTRGVTYTHENDYEDPYRLRKPDPDDPRNTCGPKIKDVPDGALYLPEIFGNPRQTGMNPNMCLTYNVPYLEEEGEYELSLRFMEFYRSENTFKRGFIIKLGTGGETITLLYDINILDLVAHCKPLSIIVPLQKSKDKLTAKGFHPMRHANGEKLKLLFCYGETLDDKVFQMSTYYVAKLAL